MAGSVVTSALKQAMGEPSGRKFEDMAKDTVNYHDEKNKLTTDFGVKVSNTDDWLKVVSDEKTGPMLLEDQVGREKVSFSYFPPTCHLLRFIEIDRYVDTSL